MIIDNSLPLKRRYDLPKNGAILAQKKHESLYEDLINVFEIDYNPGQFLTVLFLDCSFFKILKLKNINFISKRWSNTKYNEVCTMDTR